MKTLKRSIPYLLLTALVVAGCFLIAPGAQAQDNPSGSSQEVNQLLADVKTEAIALELDSEQIATWAGAKQLSWQSHAEKLNLIREHVNRAGRILSNLQDAQDTASPWQQQAIDRIYPLLKELADNTQGMINHLNDKKSTFHLSEYGDYAKAGYELAKDLATLVSDYVEYGKLEVDFHRLQEKLESKS
jgi:hypothetical protein